MSWTFPFCRCTRTSGKCTARWTIVRPLGTPAGTEELAVETGAGEGSWLTPECLEKVKQLTKRAAPVQAGYPRGERQWFLKRREGPGLAPWLLPSRRRLESLLRLRGGCKRARARLLPAPTSSFWERQRGGASRITRGCLTIRMQRQRSRRQRTAALRAGFSATSTDLPCRATR